MKNIPYLDGWRGLAICFLLLGHFFAVPGINFGTVGVALFFVLSGLLMARVLFVQQTDFGTFYRRRIARVIPSVAVYLLVITGIFALCGMTIVPAELASAATFTNNYFISTNWAMPFGHIWSLSVEEHAYIILSLAAAWCRSRGGRGIAALATILAAIILAIALYSIFPTANARLRTEVASFGIFASGFVFLLACHQKMKFEKSWVAPVGLVVGVLAHWWSIPWGLSIIGGWGALAIAVNAMSSAPRWFLAILEMPWLRQAGLYSFSLYLWQQPFYQLHHHHGMPAYVGFLLSIMVGCIAYHLVERPARTYLNTRWRGKAAAIVSYETEAEAARP